MYAAKKLADRLTEIYTHPPIPVVEIAERSRVRVTFHTYPPMSATDEIAACFVFRDMEVMVNRDMPPQQQSFAIAHELFRGTVHREHYLKDMWEYSDGLLRFGPGLEDMIDRTAKTFAMHLLVPGRLLKPVKSPGVGAAQLAQIFLVSRTLMEERLRGNYPRKNRDRTIVT